MIILNYLGALNVNHRVLKSGRSGRNQREMGLQKKGTERAALLALEAEEGATCHGMWAASKSWKGPGNRCFPRASWEECSLASSLNEPSDTTPNTRTSELQKL